MEIKGYITILMMILTVLAFGCKNKEFIFLCQDTHKLLLKLYVQFSFCLHSTKKLLPYRKQLAVLNTRKVLLRKQISDDFHNAPYHWVYQHFFRYHGNENLLLFSEHFQ